MKIQILFTLPTDIGAQNIGIKVKQLKNKYMHSSPQCVLPSIMVVFYHTSNSVNCIIRLYLSLLNYYHTCTLTYTHTYV